MPDSESEVDYVPHTVQSFETLQEIALKHDMSVKELREVNKIPSNTIYVGQQLFVKNPRRMIKPEIVIDKDNYQSHIVTKTDTLSTIALVYGMKVSELKKINNLSSNNLIPGKELKVLCKSSTGSIARRKRSKSMKQVPVVSVFAPTTNSPVRVPSGYFPHIVLENQSLADVASIYEIDVNELYLNNQHLSKKGYLEFGSFVFIKDIKDENSNTTARTVEELFADFRQASALKYTFTPLSGSDIILREPCRYLEHNSMRTILGVLTLTPDTLFFEPHPQDEEVKRSSIENCTYTISLSEIYSPIVMDESEVKHKSKGLALDFGIPGGMLKYIQISKLSNPTDEFSDVASEFYFAMHKNRIDLFYKSLIEAACTAKDKIHCKSEEDLRVKSNTLSPKPVRRRHRSESSVVIKPRKIYDKPAPLVNASTILRPEYDAGLTRIRNLLPERYSYRSWMLIYSTYHHGMSLRTFYTAASQYEASLLLIEDSKGNVFGGFAGSPWEIQDSYFGCGESFLFKLNPTTDLYPWDPSSNNYFMLAKENHFEMGGGGHPGLWIDEELKYGTSGRSNTFANECLSTTEDFEISVLEVWSFSDEILFE